MKTSIHKELKVDGVLPKLLFAESMGQANICLKHTWSNICGVHASIILHLLPYLYPSQSSMRFNVTFRSNKNGTKTVIFITTTLIKRYLLAFKHMLKTPPPPPPSLSLSLSLSLTHTHTHTHTQTNKQTNKHTSVLTR